jgi:sugar phosphate isomerase/epimerase
VDDVDAEALAEYRYARTQLGDGVVPVAELVRAIEAAGYAGYYENESAVRSRREERVSFFSEGRRRLAAWLSDEVQEHV